MCKRLTYTLHDCPSTPLQVPRQLAWSGNHFRRFKKFQVSNKDMVKLRFKFSSKEQYFRPNHGVCVPGDLTCCICNNVSNYVCDISNLLRKLKCVVNFWTINSNFDICLVYYEFLGEFGICFGSLVNILRVRWFFWWT